MTTAISLVRENAESLQPPRSLWVPFPLGRPLGVPNDAAFQHRVIAAALKLLEKSSGPVLEDYPEDAPAVEVSEAPACPVTFPTQAGDKSWQTRLSAELSTLAPWYDLGRRRRHGRTLVTVAPESVSSDLARLGDYLDREALPIEEIKWFKQAIEDAKAYYVEALTAQPGNYDQRAVYATIWHETQLGAALKQFCALLEAHPRLRLLARIVLPRDAVDANADEDAAS